jgi:predicted MFS family arabinose efflux permease
MDSSPPAATISATASPGDRVPADSVGPAPVGARLPAHVVLLFAVACGLSVATIYFAHPLLDEIARDLAIEPAVVGFAVTATQIGYGLGLVFLVPLGDVLERRRLVALQMALCAVALACVGLAPTSFSLLTALFCMGLLAVVIQTLVALTASLAPDAQRGRAVGLVTSGVVVGILLARFVSGTLADLGGWRLVYLCAAPLMLLVTALLFATIPSQRAADRVSYAALLRSLAGLLLDEPLLRARAALAFLIFMAFNVLWAPLALPLSAEPFALSHTQIGLFGLAGVAGALAASRAGTLADRGLGQRTTGLALLALVFSWGLIALLPFSLWALTAGIIVLDFAIQAVHVTSQTLIFGLRPEARSRLVAAYMVFYSAGSAVGAISATLAYAHAGWAGVSVLGALTSAAAYAVWASTRNVAQRSPTSTSVPLE